MKLHKGDTVLVISGKDKGKSGTVERVFPAEGRAVVAGINMRVRHIKKTQQQAGRKITFEASINVSKLMIVDAKVGKPSRIGYVMKDGKKKRISKLSGEEIKKAAKAKAAKKPAVKKTDAKAADKKAAPVATKAADAATPAPATKKQPFWKRMKGSTPSTGEVAEQPHMAQDHTIPDQQLHVRKGGRGS